jgi:hypothetical protein
VIQAVQDLKRLREISTVVVRHGFGELWDRAKIWDVLGRRQDGGGPRAGDPRHLGPAVPRDAADLGRIHQARPDPSARLTSLPVDFIAELSPPGSRGPHAGASCSS